MSKELVIAFVEPMYCAGRKYNNGYVLLAKGAAAEQELEQQGRLIEEWAIDDTPVDDCVGIMAWDGECTNLLCRNLGGDWEPRFSGRWRRPTAHELWSLAPKVNLEAPCTDADCGED